MKNTITKGLAAGLVTLMSGCYTPIRGNLDYLIEKINKNNICHGEGYGLKSGEIITDFKDREIIAHQRALDDYKTNCLGKNPEKWTNYVLGRIMDKSDRSDNYDGKRGFKLVFSNKERAEKAEESIIKFSEDNE